MKKKYEDCLGIQHLDLLKLEKVIPERTKLKDMKNLKLRELYRLDEDVSNVLEYKIPPILHLVWVTNHNNPKEIEEKYTRMIKTNIDLLSSSNKDWSFMFWTNNQSLIPRTVGFLNSLKVKVSNIDKMKCIDTELLSKVYQFIEDKSYADSTNLLRYSAINSYGGVYFDTDYELFKPLNKIIKTYDFAAGHVHHSMAVVENNVLMARPHHPIMQEVISMAKRNLLDPEHAPPWLRPCDFRHETFLFTGGGIVSPAFYKHANKHGNIDIVFGDKVFTDDWRVGKIGKPPEDHFSESYSAYNIPLIGRDHYAGRWFDEKWLNDEAGES